MFPLFHIFNRTISTYTIMSLIGVLVCLLTAYRLAKNNGLDEIEMLYVSLFSFGAVAVGGALDRFGRTGGGNDGMLFKLLQERLQGNNLL